MRYRRRRRNSTSSIVGDVASMAAKGSWVKPLVLGVIAFLLFSVFLPIWVSSRLEGMEGNIYQPALEEILGRRFHRLQWIGYAGIFVGLYFGIRNYLVEKHPEYAERSLATILAKLIGRSID